MFTYVSQFVTTKKDRTYELLFDMVSHNPIVFTFQLTGITRYEINMVQPIATSIDFKLIIMTRTDISNELAQTR